ncbi:hypothetical protein SLE2022_286390 [Rubroshorea leprosula]
MDIRAQANQRRPKLGLFECRQWRRFVPKKSGIIALCAVSLVESWEVDLDFSWAKQMGQRSWSSAKTFAVMGLIFSAVECVVEKSRAKHDMTNTVVAGCATGGAMSARGGPKAACAGCAGFAAFSVFIEKIFDRHG